MEPTLRHQFARGLYSASILLSLALLGWMAYGFLQFRGTIAQPTIYNHERVEDIEVGGRMFEIHSMDFNGNVVTHINKKFAVLCPFVPLALAIFAKYLEQEEPDEEIGRTAALSVLAACVAELALMLYLFKWL